MGILSFFFFLLFLFSFFIFPTQFPPSKSTLMGEEYLHLVVPTSEENKEDKLRSIYLLHDGNQIINNGLKVKELEELLFDEETFKVFNERGRAIHHGSPIHLGLRTGRKVQIGEKTLKINKMQECKSAVGLIGFDKRRYSLVAEVTFPGSTDKITMKIGGKVTIYEYFKEMTELIFDAALIDISVQSVHGRMEPSNLLFDYTDTISTISLYMEGFYCLLYLKRSICDLARKVGLDCSASPIRRKKSNSLMDSNSDLNYDGHSIVSTPSKLNKEEINEIIINQNNMEKKKN